MNREERRLRRPVRRRPADSWRRSRCKPANRWAWTRFRLLRSEKLPLSKEPTTRSAQEESPVMIGFETTPTAQTAIQQQQSGTAPIAELTKVE